MSDKFYKLMSVFHVMVDPLGTERYPRTEIVAAESIEKAIDVTRNRWPNGKVNGVTKSGGQIAIDLREL